MKMAKLPFPYVRAKLYTHNSRLVNRKLKRENGFENSCAREREIKRDKREGLLLGNGTEGKELFPKRL